MESQLNQRTTAHREALACREATGQTGRAKVEQHWPGILSDALGLQGPVSSHLSQGWGGQARRRSPLTACYRHMPLELVHTPQAWLKMVPDAVVGSAPNWADPIRKVRRPKIHTGWEDCTQGKVTQVHPEWDCIVSCFDLVLSEWLVLKAFKHSIIAIHHRNIT